VDPNSQCLCANEPHYELPMCPPGSPGCLNVKNGCKFKVWPVIAVGSPPSLDLVVKNGVDAGEQMQFVFPAKNGEDYAPGGRIYFFYRNPDNITGFPIDAKPGVPVNFVPQDYMQLFEFTLPWNEEAQKHFLDIDVSQVDQTSVPLYAYAGNNCGGVPGARCSNKECNKAYSACPAGALYKECVGGFRKSFAAEANIGQCQSPRSFCADLQNIEDPICKTFNQAQYRALVTGLGADNVPEAIYGCQCNYMDCDKCTAINRGICVDPSDKTHCPEPAWKDDPAEWYSHGLDQNHYSRWIHQKWNNSYGFSLDEGSGGGNTQCRFGTQLDVVLCPTCNQD